MATGLDPAELASMFERLDRDVLAALARSTARLIATVEEHLAALDRLAAALAAEREELRVQVEEEEARNGS